MNPIAIGLVGAGTIGGGVIKVLAEQHSFFANKLNLPIKLSRVADTVTSRFASLPVGSAICTNNADDIINDPEIQIVIELVGGTTFARQLILKALNKKKHVITANKALLAEYGPEIFETARNNGVSVYFEASVGGGMPVIKTFREAMVGNDITSVKTIINGTCNYILTQMSTQGLAFNDVLAAAQQKGYAEADPTLDVGGGDAGHKVAILASLLYGGYVPYNKVNIEGITTITAIDIAFAEELGYTIKLLGVIKRENSDATVDVRVHPAMLPKQHILASVNDVFNAVWMHGNAVGDILLYGRGAGEMPTASAVISDVVDIARNIASGNIERIPMDYYQERNTIAVKPLSEVSSRYYLRFMVLDKPGVLAKIATICGDHSISIASVMQHEGSASEAVPVIFITHLALENNVRNALAEIEKMDFTKNTTQVIRIEE